MADYCRTELPDEKSFEARHGVWEAERAHGTRVGSLKMDCVIISTWRPNLLQIILDTQAIHRMECVRGRLRYPLITPERPL